MRRTNFGWSEIGWSEKWGRLALSAVALGLMSASVMASVQEIRPRPNGDWGRNRSEGQIDIRLRVDGEAEVAVHGDRITVRTLSGRPAYDQGSEYSAPLPQANLAIDLDKRDGRGRVWLVEQPSRRNRYTAVIRISDRDGGDDRYHVRLRFQNAFGGGHPGNGDWRDNDRGNDRGNNGWGNDGYRNREPWRRPSSWNRLPGVPLDRRYQERARDYGGRSGGRFEFRGRIDDEVVFFIRGGQVTAQTTAGRGFQVERWSIDDAMPVGRPVRINIDRKDGRGRVEVLEEPNPRNNYTAVVRVYDSSGGADRYHFQLDWRY